MRTTESAIAQFNKIIIYTFFIILSFVVLYPILFCISAAFSPSNQVATMGVLPFSDGFSTTFDIDSKTLLSAEFVDFAIFS